MRLRTFARLLLVAAGIVLAAKVTQTTRNKRRGRRWQMDNVDPAMLPNDPTDPLQNLDEATELRGVPLAVDVMPAVEGESDADLAAFESDLEVVDAELVLDEAEADEGTRDSGDLYGVHTPRAVDREHPDDDHAFDEGQNWIEALETSAVENGPTPEQSLDDVIDDEDVLQPPHASDNRDVPVADRGSAGRGGL